MAFEHKESLGYLITMAGNAFANRLSRKFRENNHDITYEMWLVLNSLWQKDGQTQNELALDCYRDKSGITRLTDNLEERNLVVRIQDKTDRRINMIYLTKAGKTIQSKLIACAEAVLEEALNEISEAEGEIAGKVMKQFFMSLKNG
jgi:DNA-binding MarR family transcriptional regulator